MLIPSTHTSIHLSRFFSSSSSSSSIPNLLKRGFTPTLKCFNKLLLFLVKAQKYTLIPYLISQMNHNHIHGNSQTHSIFTSTLLKLNKFEELEHFLKYPIGKDGKDSIFSKTHIWDSLIQGFCVNKNDPDRGLQVLRDFLRCYGVLPSSYSVCSLIHCFVLRGDMDGAIEVLGLMNDCKFEYPFGDFVCSSVISGFCKIGKPEIALSFFENALSSGGLVPNLVTYTSVVGSLCMLGRVDEVCDLVCKIEKEGLAFDVVFYSSWICGYFKGGLVMDALRKYREMVGKGINGDAISYTILIDGLSKEGNVEKTVGVLHKMIQNGLRPNLVTYTAIMLGFCRKGKIDEAFAVFQTVEKLGIEMDEFIYNVLIDGFCSRGDFEPVYQLLEEMEKKGISPSVITYNTLINGLCKVGRTSDADEVSKGIWGDNITYSSLLDGYVKEKNITGILEVKRRAEEAGIPMDVVMCNILIKALFMMGAFEDVRALHDGMKEMNLVANSSTYCTMINGYCKVGRIDEALQIFDEFRRESGSSVTCYNCMISGLCRNGLVDMAIKVFIELNVKGLVLNEVMCMLLMKAIIKGGSAEEVLDVIYRIENRGFGFHGSTICNKAICLLCKRKNPMIACEVYMVAKRNNLALSRKSYYLIIKELLHDGKLWLSLPFMNSFVKEFGLVEPKARKIVLLYLCLKDVNNALYFINKMKENEEVVFFPVSALRALAKQGSVLAAYKLIIGSKVCLPFMNVVDFSIVVDALCKGGHPLRALDLCLFAEKKGVTLNIITYNSVINGLCYQGCLVEAFRLFDSLERINLIPSEITFSTLVDNLCKQGYFPDATKLLEKMVLKGYKTSIHIYNSFLIGYCKFGHIEEALKILEKIESGGLNLDEFSVSAVISGYCHHGNMEEALSFYFESKEKDKPPDFLGFLYLMRGLCAKGRMEEARSVLREMLQSQSAMELIKRVNTQVETESIDSFLAFLCEQGSIQEAITVLNEIGRMFFPVPKLFGPSISDPDGTDLDHDLIKGKMVEDLGVNGFDSCYSVIASLCSGGQLGKANQVAKEIIASWDGKC
ncbi:Pentatricopeptide repeat (PPR) superfamily protein [Euphorbia peplus]|nr:Pentatricopeptide repeat (PPR) superfamily protein [Euphorbia peplus]